MTYNLWRISQLLFFLLIDCLQFKFSFISDRLSVHLCPFLRVSHCFKLFVLNLFWYLWYYCSIIFGETFRVWWFLIKLFSFSFLEIFIDDLPHIVVFLCFIKVDLMSPIYIYRISTNIIYIFRFIVQFTIVKRRIQW